MESQSSSHIRILLGPACAVLKRQLKVCQGINDFKTTEKDKTAKTIAAREYIIRSQASIEALEKTYNRIQGLLDNWTDILSSRGHGVKEEQMLFQEFVASRGLGDEMAETSVTLQEAKGKCQLAQLMIDSISSNVAAPLTHTAVRSSHTQLPALQLPRFNGNPTTWQRFIEAFKTAVDANTELQPVEKLTYLTGLLDGDAKQLVAGFPITSDNYQIVMAQLQQRFGDRDFLSKRIMAQLNTANPKGTSSAATKAFVMEVDQLRLQLDQLHKPVTTEHLEYIFETKLSRPILERLLERRRVTTLWDSTTLINTIYDLIHHFEILKCNERSREAPSSVQINTSITRQLRSTDPIPKTRACFLCQSTTHWARQCDRYKSRDERMKRVQELRLCFRCLQPFENQHHCERFCPICGNKHHALLCRNDNTTTTKNIPQRFEGRRPLNDRRPMFSVGNNSSNFTPLGPRRISAAPTQVESINDQQTKYDSTTALTTAIDNKISTTPTLPIVPVKLANTFEDKQRTIYALLDSGSEKSFVTEQIADALQLATVSEHEIVIEGFGAESNTKSTRQVEAVINGKQQVQLLTVPMILNSTTVAHVDEDGTINIKPVTPALLIGSDLLFRLLSIRGEYLNDKLQRFDTDLGAIVLQQASTRITDTTTLSDSTENDFHDQVRNIWNMDTLGIDKEPYNTIGEELTARFEREVQFNDGRYSVKWLWKDGVTPTSNFAVAFYRLKGVMQRLSQDSSLLERYRQSFEEQIQENILEIVNTKEAVGPISYIPHHPVVTHKLRIVLDCGAKGKNGISLNDALYQGPMLLPRLLGLLLRFRIGTCIVVSDVKKAFHQLQLQLSERDAVRILLPKDWLKPIDHNNLQVYRYTRVVFGAAPSPSLLALTIAHHLRKYSNGSRLLRNLYVDNLIESGDDPRQLRQQCRNTKQIFGDASLELREYYSNIPELQAEFNPEEEAKSIVKMLGYQWYLKEDRIQLKWPVWKSEVVTKRSVLAFIGSFYDPFGITTPSTLPLKRLLQHIWEQSHGWDEPLPDEEASKWMGLIKLNSGLEKFISRKVARGSENITLAIFVDASSYAFGIAVYAINNERKPTLIFGKSRLFPHPKPTKPEMTIPKKELTALLCGVRAAKYLQTELDNIEKVFIFSDSSIALHQLTQIEVKSTFVRNRLREIHQLRENIEFRFVPTDINPADIGSRGCSAAELIQHSLWWNGPNFLQQDTSTWPNSKLELPAPESEHIISHTTSIKKVDNIEPVFYRDLPWKLLVATMLLILRFGKRFNHFNTIPGNISGAELLILRVEQQRYPPNKRALQHYRLFYDENGILRAHTRLDEANVHINTKYPIWLPTDSVIIQRLVTHIHEQHQHCDARTTTSEIRQRFWISYRFTKYVIKRCIRCKREQAKPFSMPPFAPLPKERVNIGKPFEAIGMDIAGPIYSSDGPIFFLLLTCLRIRAVHLEILRSTQADDVVNAFIRFTARRGLPSYILSDNATYFVAARKAILAKFSGVADVVWNHITPRAPYRGGVYERLNRPIKEAVRRTIGKRKLSTSELETLLLSIEASLNNRPLLPVYDDVDSHNVLRPVDFIRPTTNEYISQTQPISKEDLCDPDFLLTNTKVDELRKLHERMSNNLNRFWEQWKHNYLSMLTERTNFNTSSRDPKIGELVIIQDDDTPRSEWKLGRIVQLIKSKDGIIRSCELLTKNQKVITRSIIQLFPLEVGGEVDTNKIVVKKRDNPDHREVRQQPKRAVKRSQRAVAVSSIPTLLCILSLLSSCQAQRPIICTGKATTLVSMPQLARCHQEEFSYHEPPETKHVRIYEKNTVEYQSDGYICRLISKSVHQQTHLNGNPEVRELDVDAEKLDEDECRRMIKSHICKHGYMKSDRQIWQTHNEVEINPPNRFASFFGEDIKLKSNCLLIPAKFFAHFGSEKAATAIADISECHYSDGICRLKKNELAIWRVNQTQKCAYINVFDGEGLHSSNSLLIPENHWMMTFKKKEWVNDCGRSLRKSDQGLAVEILETIQKSRLIREKVLLSTPTTPASTTIPKRLEQVANNSTTLRTAATTSRNSTTHSSQRSATTSTPSPNNSGNRQMFGLLALSKGATKDDMLQKGYREEDINRYLIHIANRSKRQLTIADEETVDIQFMDHHILQLLQKTTYMICILITEQVDILTRMTRANPTALMQKALNRSNIIARRVNDETVEIESCRELASEDYEILPSQYCAVRMRLIKGNSIWYMDPDTHHIYKNATTNYDCATTMTISLDRILYEYDRKTGKLTTSSRNITATKNLSDADFSFISDQNELIFRNILVYEANNVNEDMLNELEKIADIESDLLIKDQSTITHHTLEDDWFDFVPIYWYLRRIWIAWVSVICALETMRAIYVVISFYKGRQRRDHSPSRSRSHLSRIRTRRSHSLSRHSSPTRLPLEAMTFRALLSRDEEQRRSSLVRAIMESST